MAFRFLDSVDIHAWGFMFPSHEVFDFEMAGVSDVGMVRANNEDAIAYDARLGIAILADGMGGGKAGEVASQLVVEHLLSGLTQSCEKANLNANTAAFSLLKFFDEANYKVLEMARAEEYAGMGTTVVAAVFLPSAVSYAHIGDSRLYRLRGGILSSLTQDHTVLQAQINAGELSLEEAREATYRNLITDAIGVEGPIRQDVGCQLIEPEDLYCLCSDGLNDMLPDEEIARVLAISALSLEDKAQTLVELAKVAGGRDNVSVILVKPLLRPAPLFRRVYSQFIAKG